MCECEIYLRKLGDVKKMEIQLESSFNVPVKPERVMNISNFLCHSNQE